MKTLFWIVRHPWYACSWYLRGKPYSAVVLLALVVFAGMGSNCVPPPPNLSPQAVTAFNQTRLEKTLDVIRDTAQDGSATTPPVVAVKDAVLVTKVHKSLVLIIETHDAGWQTQVTTGLDQLLVDLSPPTSALLKPYVALSKVILQEVTK